VVFIVWFSEVLLHLKYSQLSVSRTLQNSKHQKYILISFSNHYLALETFSQVQITPCANLLALRVIRTCKSYSHQLRDIVIWLYTISYSVKFQHLKVMGNTFKKLNYSKCKLICTSGNWDLLKESLQPWFDLRNYFWLR